MKTRRFIVGLLAVILTLGLSTSCNKTKKVLLGTWVISDSQLLEGEGELETDGVIWTFNDDMTCTMTNENATLPGTYSVDGENVKANFVMTQDNVTLKTDFDLDLTKNSSTNLTMEGTMDYTLSFSEEESFTDHSKLRFTLTKK